jgi:hypothetical protein
MHMPPDIAGALYPDIEQAGGLAAALQKHLTRLPGGLAVPGDHQAPSHFAYAQVKRDDRFSQVRLGLDNRAFRVDLWRQSVEYGGGWCSSLDDVARVSVAFLVDHASASQMRDTFGFIKVNERAFLHEAGPAAFVENEWQQLRRWLKTEKPDSPMARVLPLLEACMSRPRLRQLMPVTSHDMLCFSRTTGYPYTDDCPYAFPVAEGVFRMGGRGAVPTAIEGDAATIADALEKHLPTDCGPAVHGTAEDAGTARS